MLASLHWRIVGKSRLALDCLQLALDDVPTEFRDVPFVSIASIYHKVGLIDDAIRLTNEALEINAVEVYMNNIFILKITLFLYINKIKNYLIIIDIIYISANDQFLIWYIIEYKRKSDRSYILFETSIKSGIKLV